jgi:asparagine synthase (glutamine-hydrolysing)
LDEGRRDRDHPAGSIVRQEKSESGETRLLEVRESSMPGIVGIIGRGPRGQHEVDLKLMIDCMMHEPFYQSGSYINEALGVYVGWTCHEDSYADCMPATTENKDVVLLFAGEQFAEKSNVEDRRASGLVRGYEEEGEEFLKNLNGWFSALLVDVRKSKAILFNDRYGMQRVYFHEGDNEFLFSSEAKSLLKVRPELRHLDMKGLGELISCNCVLENRTIFPKISLLPGGSSWVWEKGSVVTKKFYFKASEWESLPLLEEDVFVDRLSETVKKVIPRYFRERGRVGMSLTGGLDSRMIMACLNLEPGELPCYTFGGKKDMLDISIAQKVAKACHQTHKVIRLGSSFFSEFPCLAEKTIYVTDGNLDVCNTHDMFFNRLAREIAPIRVTGKFGSEVIRDHTMFNAGLYRGGLFAKEFQPHVDRAIETLGEVKKGHKLSVAVFKDFPWREYNKIAIEQSQSVFRSPYMDNDLVKLMFQAPGGVRASNQPQRRIIRECNPLLSAIISDRGYGEQANPVASMLLELYYYALFKADYIYIFALPHWLTRLDSMCLRMNGGRPLFGSSQKFEYYRIWFRNELSDYVKEILLDPETAKRPYFDMKCLEMMVQTHTRGTGNYINEINKAMTLELTHRLLIDA